MVKQSKDDKKDGGQQYVDQKMDEDLSDCCMFFQVDSLLSLWAGVSSGMLMVTGEYGKKGIEN